MHCPKCNYVGDGVFCPKCGTKLLNDPIIHTCPMCGYKSDGNFCPMCGTAFAMQYPHEEFKSFHYTCFSDDSDVMWTAKYVYDCVPIYRPDASFSEIFMYDSVDVVPEPSNPYDSNAISFVFHGNVIGYLNKGTLQDMTHDFLNRGDLVKAQVQKIEGCKIYLKLFFCQKRSKLLPPVDSFSVRLVGNAKEEWQDNLMLCGEGDSVDFDFDVDAEKYLVTDCGSEIGYIPALKTLHIRSLEDKGYVPLGEVIEADYSDSGKYYAVIEVSFA